RPQGRPTSPDRETKVATAVGSRPRSRRARRTWAVAVLFLLPALALYALFVLFPIVQAARFSFYDWNGLEAMDQFVGLANYQRALADPVFRGAVTHNALIVVLSLAIQIPFALGLAVMLNRRF